MKHILIVGASSDIALACARRWLEVEREGTIFYLLGRSEDRLNMCAEDLLVRGAVGAHVSEVDFSKIETYREEILRAISVAGPIDVALVAHGSLPIQTDCELDDSLSRQEFFTNATSTICWLSALGSIMQGHSTRESSIAVISSVAGDRGRESNYLYGSAKAAVSTFCDGLRIRLGRSGISVTDIRPGMVDTAMTKNLELPQLLLASRDEVARVIVSAITAKQAVTYAPRYWRLIMLVIRLLPRFIFRRLNL